MCVCECVCVCVLTCEHCSMRSYSGIYLCKHKLTMSSYASLMAVRESTPISGAAVEKTFTEERVGIAYQKRYIR